LFIPGYGTTPATGIRAFADSLFRRSHEETSIKTDILLYAKKAVQRNDSGLWLPGALNALKTVPSNAI